MNPNTIKGTLLVSVVLCVVCSLLVSSAAVLLRPLQEANKKLDLQRNVLLAAGVDVDSMSSEEIVEMFNDETKVKRVLIDLSTGEAIDSEAKAEAAGIDLASYDSKKAAKNPKLSQRVHAKGGPTFGISRREKYAYVYQILKGNKIEQFVLPIYGKGLWSTLYGFLALQGDVRTVGGITFYEHKETPGLGGEVDNPRWKAKWAEKQVFDDQGKVDFRVVKGTVDPNSAQAAHQVDGLSGATITSRGVSNMVQYWVGPDGFGKFLEKQRAQQ
ncbi:MAG: Na(+)-translocating NADH-quinone reductase subunit C [Planctomycetes bacterium]|nr:Na(+)-translocating NADH-quinone reductase subunit C [Planctomycetota bacterium]